MNEKPSSRSKSSFNLTAARKLKPYLTEKGVSYLNKRIQIGSKTDDRIVSVISSGKVRNMYGFDIVLFETSDRLSVFDRVIKENVSLKGAMLNCISQHNKEYLEELGIKTDLVGVLMSGSHQADELLSLCDFNMGDFNRISFAKKLNMFPLEFIVRGYIVGSAWKAYKRGESYCGFTFPEGLKEGQKLETAILTPTTKASSGHDMPVTRKRAVEIVADWLIEEDLILLTSDEIREICDNNLVIFEEIFDVSYTAKNYGRAFLLLTSDDDWWDCYAHMLAYCLAESYINSIYNISLYAYHVLAKMAKQKGILFIDTKFEFGLDKNGEICLGDEVGTPDSSRFAPKKEYEETGKIISLDKQIVRDYCSDIGFTGEPDQAIPELPNDLWDEVTKIYVHIAELICGEEEVAAYK